MSNRKKFLQDSEDVISGLEEALQKLLTLQGQETMRRTTLRIDRDHALTRHLDRLFPDLEESTLEGLREIEGLDIALFESVFARAQNIHVSIWSQLTGTAAEKRKVAMVSDFRILHVQLSSFIDRDKVNLQFHDLRYFSDQIVESEANLAELKRREAALQKDLGKAYKVIHQNSGRTLPLVLAQQMGEHADKLREAKSQQANARPERNDADYTDVLLLWAFGVPTSGRTVVLDALFHDQSTQDSVPPFGGSGQFEGAGVGRTWTGSDAPQDSSGPQPPDSSSMVTTAAYVAAADSLGVS